MICIYCQGDTKVVNSRHQKRSNSVWRRRQCLVCHTVFTSVEEPDLAGSIVVRKPKTPVEPFSRDKLLLSVYDSLRHRETALKDAEGLCGTIISQLLPKVEEAALDATLIAKVTYTVLRRFDKAAATFYLAYHPLDSVPER